MQRISKKGRDFIRRWEGEKLKPYKDVAGLWTIGVGHLIDTEHESHLLAPEGISQEQSDELLMNDLDEFDRYVRNMVDVPLEQHQFDSLVSLVFNIGPGNFQTSTVRKRINGNYPPEEIAEAWKRWKKAGGKVVQGLINRRDDEVNLYQTGEYEKKKHG